MRARASPSGPRARPARSSPTAAAAGGWPSRCPPPPPNRSGSRSPSLSRGKTGSPCRTWCWARCGWPRGNRTWIWCRRATSPAIRVTSISSRSARATAGRPTPSEPRLGLSLHQLVASALAAGHTAASLAADIKRPFADTWGVYLPVNYDTELHGLHISPDIDTVTYTLTSDGAPQSGTVPRPANGSPFRTALASGGVGRGDRQGNNSPSRRSSSATSRSDR